MPKGTPASMRITVKELSGKSTELKVSPSIQVGPVGLKVERFAISGRAGISAQNIQGVSKSAVVKAASKVMSQFWSSAEGKGVREYLEKQVIADENSPQVGLRLRLRSASVDELLVEFSRFFVLKAINSDTAPPRLASEPPMKRVRVAPSAQLSPSHEVDQVWHALMLFPQVYQNLCSELTGELICHDPRSNDESHVGRYCLTFKKRLGM